MIMAGIYAKDMRVGLLKQLLAPMEEQGDNVAEQARKVLEEELMDMESEAHGFDVCLQCPRIGHNEVMAVTWKRLVATTRSDPELGQSRTWWRQEAIGL